MSQANYGMGLLCGSGAACSLMLLAATARAQQEGAGSAETMTRTTVEVIVVTARKREESVQDVPISIAATSGEEIEAKSLRSLADLAQFTPNVTFSSSPARGNGGGVVFIRGVGQQETSGFQPGVGIYQDGIYIAHMQGFDLNLMDVDRVEVLRGPQGTLFGKNTVGGAINYVSKPPQDEFSGTADLTVGSFNRYDGRLSLNVPLIPGELAGRFTVVANNQESYTERVDFFTGRELDQPDNENYSGRAVISWSPSDAFDAVLAVDGRRLRGIGAFNSLATVQQIGALPAYNTFVTPDVTSSFITGDPYRSFATGPNHTDIDAFNAGLTLTRDFGAWQIKSITGYRDLDTSVGNDFDGTPHRLLEQSRTWDQWQLSQELQFTGRAIDDHLDWLLGLYYLKDEEETTAPTFILGELRGPTQAPINDVGGGESESYAVFGQGTYALTDRLNATLGVRYSADERSSYSLRYLGVAAVPQPPVARSEGDWDAWSGLGSLDYHWTESLMTYVSVSRGYKSGLPVQLGANQPSVDPEYVLAYEVGLKSELFDDRVRFNAAVFHSDYTEQQLFVRILNTSGTTDSYITNAGESRIRGLEADLIARVTDGLSFGASVGYIDAEYTKLKPGAPVTTATKMIEIPETTVALNAEYVVSLSGSGSLTTRIDYAHRSSIEHDLTNARVAHQDPYGLLNARVTYEHPSGWSVAAFGTNLQDTEYLMAGLSQLALGIENQTYGRPREWGVELRIRF